MSIRVRRGGQNGFGIFLPEIRKEIEFGKKNHLVAIKKPRIFVPKSI